MLRILKIRRMFDQKDDATDFEQMKSPSSMYGIDTLVLELEEECVRESFKTG